MANSIRKHPACQQHNHQDCIRTAMQKARAICTANEVRLTTMRERVLEIIWQSHKPIGAYEILALLSDANKVIAPPTVYRAIEFLMEQGLVHRIASLNAYIGCSQAQQDHISQFLLCSECGIAIETDARLVSNSIHEQAAGYGFIIDQETIEISGRCPRCLSR